MENKKSKIYRISVAVCAITFTVVIGFLIVRAGNLDPTSAPGDTMKTLDDIYCKQIGCTTSSYGIDSPANPTSTMHTLTEIYDQVPAFPNHEHQRYDDWNCAANNTEPEGTCAAGDPEYVGDQGNWSSSTDATPPANLNSGKVYKDLTTGLYWSDKATTEMSNGFGTMTNECTDSAITNGTCDPCSFTTKGDAVTLCCDLDLDCSANGCSSSTDWRLPTQKELLQAYIDGAANRLPSPNNYFWTSTESSPSVDYAWRGYLLDGDVDYATKSSDYCVCCVRR